MVLKDEIKNIKGKFIILDKDDIEISSAIDTLENSPVYIVGYDSTTNVTKIKLDVTALCPRCSKELIKSDLPDYKYLCKNCEENFYGIEIKKYRKIKTQKDIDRELSIVKNIWNKTIYFSNSGEGDIVCHIGEYWFYFYEGHTNANEITPNNIHTYIEIFELAAMIRESIEVLDGAEYGYYAAILGWEVA